MKRFGYAWLTLALALALHVADEALHDFLSVYNPAVLRIHERLPWLPLPTFTFPVWIAGLTAAVVLLLMLTKLAMARPQWMLWPARMLALLMILNGSGHLGGSLYFGVLLPGSYSSPFLIAAGIFLLCESRYN